MMIRGDQHVDDWAEVAIDYLDGRLDEQGRAAVEAHLSGCPECAARLHKQQRVVMLLQEALLVDPPDDLEYRCIGEIIFPSPGSEPALVPAPERKVYRSPRWYRTVRAWLPATVAIVALLSAVVAYGVVRSDQRSDLATDSARTAEQSMTTVAAAATTAAPVLGEEYSAAAAGSADKAEVSTTAAPAATVTTTTAAGEAPANTQISTFAATEDPRAMVRALQNTQSPAYLSFRGDSSTTTGTDTPAGKVSTTTAGSRETGTTAGSATTASPVDITSPAPVSAEKVSSLLEQIKEFTGLEPVDESLWLGGPTFAVYLPRKDASKLVDLMQSMSSSLELAVSMEGEPPAALEGRCSRLLEDRALFPVLKAHRAGQPATVGWDFTTSTLAPASAGGQTDVTTMPSDSHLILVIWIVE